ncbi:MAG: hypothetical protein BGP13_13885 [Sphingobacteriales bacterium 40-81]|nr:MAG: hypothetical protein BGP13_13885 [Sphingobacteriales bacterium 40-81]
MWQNNGGYCTFQAKFHTLKKLLFLLSLAVVFIFFITIETNAQMITGVWHGRINRQKIEIKIVQKGDSLVGTSYYYQSPGNYRRYSIRGYFDGINNEAVWWDDQFLEEKTGRMNIGSTGKDELISRADFNCPGGGIMKLDGNAALKENEDKSKGEVHLDKANNTAFNDEWDFVIENYTVGANDPFVIDSVNMIARQPAPVLQPQPERTVIPVREEPAPKPIAVAEEKRTITPLKPLTIEEKFTQRQKVPIMEIPVSGDSIELNFYDNAEIDGDSITLFLNEKLIFQHIYLTDKAFTVKIPVSDLQQTNELVMVAENLGSIPPNTSFMVANVGGKRYEARLVSTEGSSAMIKFVKNDITGTSPEKK